MGAFQKSGTYMDGIGNKGTRRAMEDEASCVICFGEERECDVYFSPCSHKACKACVQKLRVANVYKADKGVRCPICRQVIEGYLDGPLVSVHENAIQRESEKNHKENLYGRAGIMSIGYGNDYVPPKGVTGGLKMNFRMDELYAGYVVPPLKPDSDLLAMALDKTGARHLDHMLRDTYAKRHKVAKMCREMLVPFAGKLAMHGSANFVLQRMLDYAAAHRANGGNSECFYTAIVRSLCRDNGLVMAAQDLRGTFSAQKMLLLMQGAEEFKLVLKGVSGSVGFLALHPHGVYVLQRLAEAMITSLNPPSGQKPRVPANEAVRGLALLAAEMTSKREDIVNIGLHQVSGPMLVECIRWSLPENQSRKAALAVVAEVKKLIGSKIGHRTLQGMLSLEVKEVAEGIIHALEGEFVGLDLDSISWGCKLVRACLATHSVDESCRLLIVDELMNSVCSESNMTLIDPRDVFAFGLSLLTRRCLDVRLDKLRNYLPSTKFERFKSSVEGMRAVFVEAPPIPEPPNSVMDAWQEDEQSMRSTNNVVDPWDDPSMSNLRQEMKASTPALSEGSVSELSVEANSDSWEQLAISSQEAETSTSNGVYTSLPRGGSGGLSKTSSIDDVTSKPVPYAPPHLRNSQALGASSQVATQRPSEEHLQKVGTIGSQRTSSKSCVLCASQAINAVLLDCSHMCCCLKCAYTARVCPVCQIAIRQVVEVKPFISSATSQVTTPQSLPPASQLFPTGSHLLPLDLFQTLSLNCEIPSKLVDSSYPRSQRDQLENSTCSSNTPYSSSNSYPTYPCTQRDHIKPSGLDPYSFELLNLSNPQPGGSSFRNSYNSQFSINSGVNEPVPRRPYRPPDVFDNGFLR